MIWQTIGGAKGLTSGDARREIVIDLNRKSLENKAVNPRNLAHGIIFFPGEAPSAKQLRLQLIEVDSGKVHILGSSPNWLRAKDPAYLKCAVISGARKENHLACNHEA